MAPRSAPALTLRAGPDALRHLRERGLRPGDVDVVPGASGGAKWLALAGSTASSSASSSAPAPRPLHAIGSSIGSWRMACLGQRDPAAALARGHDAYVDRQRYSSRRPPPAEVSAVLDGLPRRAARRDRGGRDPRPPVGAAARDHRRGARAGGERAPRRAHRGARPRRRRQPRRAARARLQLTRCIFHSAGADTPFAHLRDLPTVHRPLTRENVRAALRASGSIPLLMEGVRVPGAPGVHWDGGVLDYHLDLDFAGGPTARRRPASRRRRTR
jgi:hypothetical protein